MIELDVRPVVLEGSLVRLEPLAQEHAQSLYSRGRHEPDWVYMPRACFVDAADVRHWIDDALASAGQLAFAIVEKEGQGGG